MKGAHTFLAIVMYIHSTESALVNAGNVNVSYLSTLWGTSTRIKTVERTTYTTDCKNTTFQIPIGWYQCMGDRTTCIWFKNNSIARGSDCRYTDRWNSKNSGLVNAFRGDYVEKIKDDTTNLTTYTHVFPSIDIEYVEGLPTYVDTIVIDHAGIKTLNKDLSKTLLTNIPITAKSIQMIGNKITSIDGVIFSDSVQSLVLNGNDIETIGHVNAPSLITLGLAGNKIRSLDGATFPSSLQELHLQRNNLQHLANAAWPVGLRSLYISSNDLTSISYPLPSTLTDLRASNMNIKSLDGLSLPSNLKLLSFINNSVTELRANFPSTLKFLYFWNTNITAFYANVSQYEILVNITTKCTALSSDAELDDYCSNLFSTNSTSRDCRGHIRIEYLYGRYPICIIKDDTAPLNSKSIVITVGISGGVLILIAVLLAHWTRLRNQKKWYNEHSGGSFLPFDENSTIANDIRKDNSFSNYYIPPNDIECINEIGRGGYGIIYMAKMKNSSKKNKKIIALKRLLPSKINDITEIESFMEEIRLFSTLSHHCIIDFIGVTWTTLSNVSMLMEYMILGDVWSLLVDDIKKKKLIEWDILNDIKINFDKLDDKNLIYSLNNGKKKKLSKINILKSVVDALVYLHSLNIPIIHRDIKARNILVNDQHDIKLSDFGTSRERVLDYTMTCEIGTIPWVAPEVLKGVRYSEKADIYSIGVLISELDTVEIPYSNLTTILPDISDFNIQIAKTKIMMMVVAGELRPSVTHQCPNSIYDITRRCIAYNPNDRPSAKELQKWLNYISSS